MGIQIEPTTRSMSRKEYDTLRRTVRLLEFQNRDKTKKALMDMLIYGIGFSSSAN